MANIVRFGRQLNDLQDFIIFDDFWYDQTDLFWIDTITDSGSVAIGDVANGIALLTCSDGSVGDNDECYFGTPNSPFLFAANRGLYFRTSIQYTEINTNDANIAVGFMSAPNTTNSIIDDGGGPRASGTLALIEKRDGETEWRLTTRRGSAVTTTLSTATAGGSAFHTLEIFVHDYDGGTNMQITAAMDGVLLRDTNNAVIKHTRLIASADQMAACFLAKNGSANLTTLNVDYCYASQTR